MVFNLKLIDMWTKEFRKADQYSRFPIGRDYQRIPGIVYSRIYDGMLPARAISHKIICYLFGGNHQLACGSMVQQSGEVQHMSLLVVIFV